MDRSGALKLTAISIVLVLGVSTLGFGLALASDPKNSTAAATSQSNNDGHSSGNGTQCGSASSIGICLNAAMIAAGPLVKGTITVK